ncbi:MAG: hypothetical protein ABI586_06305 [Candidatus Nanopelagicales bacterium]
MSLTAASSLGLLVGCTSDVDPSLPDVAAARADDLCESYLVNTKTFYAPTVYGWTEAVVDLVRELGAQIVRERVAIGSSPGAIKQRSAMTGLLAAGVRWHATVGELQQWPEAGPANARVISFLTDTYSGATDGTASALLHSLGGCNEVDGDTLDGARDPEWGSHARAMQQALWDAAHAEPFTRTVPVAGPSTRTDVTPDRAAELGDLTGTCDWGNAHLYLRGTSPSRSLDEQLALLDPCFPDVDHWVVTETGYNDSRATGTGLTVPEQAAASYAVRGICDFFRRDAVYGRFELLDDPDPIDYSTQQSINRTANRDAHFGLVAMTNDTVEAATPDTWRKKPEFYATQRLLALLSDPGQLFAPAPLRLAVSGSYDLQQLLLQKRDGRHYLLLWRDVAVATPYPAGRPINVASTTVTVRMRPARPVAMYVPATSDGPVATIASTHTAQVEVAGDLLVLEIG